MMVLCGGRRFNPVTLDVQYTLSHPCLHLGLSSTQKKIFNVQTQGERGGQLGSVNTHWL